MIPNLLGFYHAVSRQKSCVFAPTLNFYLLRVKYSPKLQGDFSGDVTYLLL